MRCYGLNPVTKEVYPLFPGEEPVLGQKVAQFDKNGVCVSTVFLAVDYSLNMVGKPLLFETKVFGGVLDDEVERYYTYDEAAEGHRQWVKKVEETFLIDNSSSQQATTKKATG